VTSNTDDVILEFPDWDSTNNEKGRNEGDWERDGIEIKIKRRTGRKSGISKKGAEGVRVEERDDRVGG
jgi:hypothetical protein